ncbi:MAG TPA: ATP-binding protein [Candidatus Paceibacterota bacterium]|nr:ATP-binding protein [Candidatus Paceibacterota bacterium]
MPLLQIFSSENFDLVSTGITVAAIAVLGVSIYISNKKSITNRTFLLFSIVIIAYATSNYLSYHVENPDLTIWFLRGIIFFATWASLLLFQLFYVFPDEHTTLPRYYIAFILPCVIGVSLLTMTPYVFESVKQIAIDGAPATAQPGPLIASFGLTCAVLVILSIVILVKKYIRASGILRQQMTFIVIGSVITFLGILFLNVWLPLVYDNARYIIFAPVLFFPFLGLTGYAILRYKLFNIKIATIAILAFLLAVTIIFQAIFSSSAEQKIFGASQFILVIVFSIWLLQATLREVEQRELIEIQERELEGVNRQQESLLHFMSHEIKGYLTKSEAGFSAIAEGDYGQVSPELSGMASMALVDIRKGVRTVMDILDASNLKRGTVSYKKTTFDLKEVVQGVVKHLKPAIDEKRLTVEMSIAWEVPCLVNADMEKIRDHVIRNLVDNAIKYTPSGSIKVEVLRIGDTVRFSVQDSGVGITDEDKKRLFTEGGHGKDSIKVNVHSTGYGLFIAKTIVDAHGGKIWAESDGAGTGSRFIMELPAA